MVNIILDGLDIFNCVVIYQYITQIGISSRRTFILKLYMTTCKSLISRLEYFNVFGFIDREMADWALKTNPITEQQWELTLGEIHSQCFLGNKRGWLNNWWHKNKRTLFMYMHIIPNTVRRR